jgi:hypothetical protein
MCFRCASEKVIGGYSFSTGCVSSAGFFPTDHEKTILPKIKCFRNAWNMLEICSKHAIEYRSNFPRLRVCVCDRIFYGEDVLAIQNFYLVISFLFTFIIFPTSLERTFLPFNTTIVDNSWNFLYLLHSPHPLACVAFALIVTTITMGWLHLTKLETRFNSDKTGTYLS